MGEFFQQRVPEGVQAVDMAHLADAHPVGGVGGLPEGQGIDIKILAVGGKPQGLDFFRYHAQGFGPGLLIAQVQQPVVARAVALEEPFRMGGGLGRGLDDPLGLNPEHKAHALFLQARGHIL